jgi:hypothetical protein
VQRRELADATHRLLNLRRTVVLAEEEIEQTALDGSTPAEETTQPVDSDWLYRWKERAERVSIEEMQRLWAKILAGEIGCPGSYSLRTLELLFSLTRGEAKLITEAAKFCINAYGRDRIIYRIPRLIPLSQVSQYVV